ncbi:MAG: acetylxylan esterase [Herpetosiphonaceae bacterium]|nr:acetylxylan esterase [Herpetosiphonaceae bacterium]
MIPLLAEQDRMGPLPLYHHLYNDLPRRYAMPDGSDPAAWTQWRNDLRRQLRQRLNLLPASDAPFATQYAPTTQHSGYRRQYIEFASDEGSVVPAWLLIPDGITTPRPAVIALHGHGYGVDDIVGINPDGTDRTGPPGYHADFALALCRRGFVVIAPELLAFGRRRELSDIARGTGESSCHDAALWGIMLGRPLLGRRVYDVLRTLDYLATRPEVDPASIGIMGLSGGGTVTLCAAALDERLRAIVLSGYLCTFRDSILAIDHCLCNYVPGLLEDAEMYDLAALFAPRPLLVEAGTLDQIFPIVSVKVAYERVAHAYAAAGVADHLDHDFFEGSHQISGAKAYDFLWDWLGKAEPEEGATMQSVQGANA